MPSGRAKTRPKPKPRPTKQKTKVKKATHTTRYNIYSYDEAGRGRKVKTMNDPKEARSYVSNMKATKPNMKLKVVPETKRKLW